jgi:hypothetical protein
VKRPGHRGRHRGALDLLGSDQPLHEPARKTQAPSRIALARAATIARLAATMAEQLGRAPTDAELAALLARSPASIARLRRLAEGGR